MVVGLTEYPWKRCEDIFLCVIYSKVVHIYDYIHKAVYIIICALVRVFCLCRYFAQAVYNLWYEQFELAESKGNLGFVCRSFSNDFAGCITAAYVSKKQEEVMVLTSLFVPETFRGLGIGTELISMCLSEFKKLGKKWLILPKMFIPDFLEPLLLRTGFDKIDSGFAVSLQ